MKTIPHYDVPRDLEDPDYVKSFSLSQPAEARAFFAEFGFVVFHSILSDKECADSVSALFDLLDFDPEDPSTWAKWPKTGMEKFSMPTRGPLFSPAFLSNRQNGNVLAAFATIMGRNDLIVNHDRGCLFRPTRGNWGNGANAGEKVEWRTERNLHFDMNPWAYVDPAQPERVEERLESLEYGTLKDFIFENNQVSKATVDDIPLQGVLNFLDNREEDGGFIIVPGFIHHFDEWIEKNKHLAAQSAPQSAGKNGRQPQGQKQGQGQEEMADDGGSSSFKFPAKDPMQMAAIRVSMKKGSLVIWDQRTPHGSMYNQSGTFRAAQFLKMFPMTHLSPERAARRGAALMKIIQRAGFDRQISPTGMQVFGFNRS